MWASLNGARAAWVAVVVAAVVIGCDPSIRYSTPSQAEMPTIQSDFALEAGDTFEVKVFDEDKMSGPYRVAPDGTIDFPLLGQIRIAGLLAQEVAQDLRKRLLEGRFLRNPQVSVLIKDQASKKIFILGQVTKPGTLSYVPNMNIVEAIGGAGGFTSMALKNGTTVTRVDGQGRKVSTTIPVADISAGRAGNYYLRPGDMIWVPERIF